jgi:hypothetical protein
MKAVTASNSHSLFMLSEAWFNDISTYHLHTKFIIVIKKLWSVLYIELLGSSKSSTTTIVVVLLVFQGFRQVNFEHTLFVILFVVTMKAVTASNSHSLFMLSEAWFNDISTYHLHTKKH